MIYIVISTALTDLGLRSSMIKLIICVYINRNKNAESYLNTFQTSYMELLSPNIET